MLATLKAFGLRTNPRGGKLIERWTPAIDGPPSTGRADSGDMEIDLLELLTDVAGLAAGVGHLEMLESFEQAAQRDDRSQTHPRVGAARRRGEVDSFAHVVNLR